MNAAYLSGFQLGLGLIVAIGAQNAFVLRQGLRREHVLATVLVCAISDAALRNNGHTGREAPKLAPPLLFSKPFMEVIGLAIVEGRVSTRRAAGLLDLTVEDLTDLFVAHGVEPPAEL